MSGNVYIIDAEHFSSQCASRADYLVRSSNVREHMCDLRMGTTDGLVIALTLASPAFLVYCRGRQLEVNPNVNAVGGPVFCMAVLGTARKFLALSAVIRC